MKTSKFLCLLILTTVISVSGFSQQPYERGIGARITPSNSYYDLVSASYKFFITEPGAIELNGGVGLRKYAGWTDTNGDYHYDRHPFSLSLSASYQHHFEIPVRGGGFAWFIGGGLTGYTVISKDKGREGFGFGIFPTGGVDYKIPKIPLAVSADYRPTIMIASPDKYDSFYGSNFGLSARYTFGKN